MLDGGDLFGRPNANDREQTRFLCSATGDLGFDAIGLGEKELNYGLPFLMEMIEKYDLPYVNANVRDTKTGELILPEYLVVEKAGIKFGITSVLTQAQKLKSMTDDDLGLEVQAALPVLRELIPRMREEVDSVVLVGHLGEGSTETALKDVVGVDIAVMGHTFRNIKTERVVGDCALFSSAHEGRYIGRADLFIDATDGSVQAIQVESIDLDDKIENDPDMLERVNGFKEEMVAFNEAKRSKYPRSLGSEKESYLGDRSCKKCHEDLWASYAESQHMRAFRTIRLKGQNTEPECLVCHTTGYRFMNGYEDERPYNDLINVQCEACHGYGSEHARDGKWAAQAKDSCVVCHDQENSPEFDYATYWEKIKH